MKRTLASLTFALAAVLSLTALAQTGNAATPAATTTSMSTPVGPAKIGVINMNVAIQESNEGQKEFQTMEQKFEPRQKELNTRAKELQSLKDQLKTQGDKLNDDARATLVNSIQTKEKSLQRDGDDFNSEVQNAQNEIVQKILKKMGPVILKYAQDNSLSMIVDTSNPWPQSPLLWSNPSMDITKAVVDAYNVQSGVPAPAASSTPGAPSATRPAATAPARKPATTTPTAPPK